MREKLFFLNFNLTFVFSKFSFFSRIFFVLRILRNFHVRVAQIFSMSGQFWSLTGNTTWDDQRHDSKRVYHSPDVWMRPHWSGTQLKPSTQTRTRRVSCSSVPAVRQKKTCFSPHVFMRTPLSLAIIRHSFSARSLILTASGLFLTEMHLGSCSPTQLFIVRVP